MLYASWRFSKHTFEQPARAIERSGWGPPIGRDVQTVDEHVRIAERPPSVTLQGDFVCVASARYLS